MTQQEFFKRFTYSVSADRIGGGGFGTVYKAKDHVLHRTVAIKVSEVKATADGQKTFSLKDEFEALNHVPKHPNIANYEEFYSFEMPNGIFDYAVMQYYPDGNLSTAIKQGLTAEQKEDIATQLLEGIAFLHEHKVVHRDLKPGNILIVRDGESIIPLITDFGLSKAANLGDGSVFSNSFGGGTQRYSSPEQLQGKPLRLNTDLWSYGAILYELFTSEQLFSAGSGAANSAQADLEIYNKIVNGDVRSLGGMPEKWRKVAERCLVVDADKRAKDETELLRIVSGEAQEDETVADIASGSGLGASSGAGSASGSAVGSGGFAIHQKGNGDLQSPSDDEETAVANKPQPKEKAPQPKGGSSTASATSNDKPKSKKGLWIGLGAAVVAAIVAVLLLSKPKDNKAPAKEDAETGVLLQHVFENDTWDPFDYIESKTVEINEPASFDLNMRICFTDDYPFQYFSLGFTVLDENGNPERFQNTEYILTDEQGHWRVPKTGDVYTFILPIDKGMVISESGKYKFMLEQKIHTTLVGVRELALINNNQIGNASEETRTDEENTANGHEYVDLGLPSGTLWATCNVGASKPEDYGDYFAWGETESKDYYDWDTYTYRDNPNIFPSDHDVATANWGGGWQMPSRAQWKELLDNTTKKWTTRNGVSGMLFEAKNGQRLFLPAAGCQQDESGLRHAGSIGNYWLRLLLSDDMPDLAWGFYFDSDYANVSDNNPRYEGFSVRPVREN